MIFKKEMTNARVNERRFGLAFRFFGAGLLLIMVVCEAYCLFLLRERFSVRSDELKSLSMQLQSFKNEEAKLQEELSSLNYATREDADGNPSFR